MSQDARRVDPIVAASVSRAPSPGFIEPCRPTLREEAPSGERWVHEIKFDGCRAQAHLQAGLPAIYTRRGHDWTLRFQPIADALTALPAPPSTRVLLQARDVHNIAARPSPAAIEATDLPLERE
jgi:ATP-dependent DNA ligase